jgi:glycerophosphoryl diester phosphodiesterase
MEAPYLELDVRMTRDGHLVVIHDRTVDRTTDGSGPVDRMTLEEIRRLDAGYRFRPEGRGDYPFRGKGIRIPTLKEVLEAFPEAFLNIEIKQDDPRLDEALAEVLVTSHALERVLLASADGWILKRIRERLGGRVATGISREEGLKLAPWILFGRGDPPRVEGQALQIPRTLKGWDFLTQERVERAHRLGIEVHVWTVNEPEEMERLLEMGVDGIMTDYPDRFPQRALDRSPPNPCMEDFDGR